ncbi:beta-sandwich lipoprotein [Bacillus sp. 18-5]|uniref:beta-sandwich lipoprotein n=1 Tax=Bacillus sp. 18-5 TaxID=3458701 RepID=UPI0040462EF7
MKKKLLVLLVSVMAIMAGCSEADVVSENISKSSDSFEVQRRIVFFNGITDKYLLTVEGLCALGNSDSDLRMTVTCKVAKDEYKKHYLGLSDNVSFFAEQLEPNKEDPFHYKILFRPENIIPDIELQTSKTKK